MANKIISIPAHESFGLVDTNEMLYPTLIILCYFKILTTLALFFEQSSKNLSTWLIWNPIKKIKKKDRHDWNFEKNVEMFGVSKFKFLLKLNPN